MNKLYFKWLITRGWTWFPSHSSTFSLHMKTLLCISSLGPCPISLILCPMWWKAPGLEQSRWTCGLCIRQMRCFSLPATLAALVFLWGRFPARPCWSVTVALEPRWSLCPESCEASSVCQRGLGSHDGSPVDTMPGSRPDGVPSSTLINLIPINLRDRALLCHLRLFCEGGQNPPGPRANVTGMNQLLMCVIGANDFSFFCDRRAEECWSAVSYFRSRGRNVFPPAIQSRKVSWQRWWYLTEMPQKKQDNKPCKQLFFCTHKL